MTIEDYYRKSVGFAPNPLQQAVWESYHHAGDHPALLIKAGTGTGKTEAILLPALEDRRRVIMVLPSKALIEDMGERVQKIGEKLSSNCLCDLNITTDMGGACRRYCCRNGKSETNTYHRHLFADDIVITTLDKFLFRVFGYGEAIKSYIFPHRIFGSSLGKRPFVIFDEAHEYEGLAFSNFVKLLEALFVKGKDLCVMSATMPPQFTDFLSLIDAGAGKLSEQMTAFQEKEMGMVRRKKYLRRILSGHTPEKQPSLFPSESSKDIVSVIAEEVRKSHDSEKRIIARTETVSDLLRVYEKLKDLNPLIYHGRLTSSQRRKVIHLLIEAQSRDRGFLLLATSAVETGCDLDTHQIVTELCNPDSLVQLAGRLNRRGKMSHAELVVVGDKIKHFVSSLTPEQVVAYLQDLDAMKGIFDPEKLQKYFRTSRGDRMGEILFDMLWEYVYEGDLTSKPLWDKGILVTRSWEPSITVCTGLNFETKRPLNPIQTGISRLAGQISKSWDELRTEKASDWLDVSEEGEWHATVYRAFYNAGNREESRWSVYPLPEKYPVNCYETDLICVIKDRFKKEYYDEVLGYIRLPKIFIKGYKEGFRQYLYYQPKIRKDSFSITKNKKYPEYSGRVWFLDRKEK